MNINKFTQKSMQAVQDCERIALEYGNQEIEQEHLLYALLTQDDYVSVEHIFLAIIKYANRELKTIFREMGITRDGFLKALSTVRGNQRVTSDNPESTYDTLNKYGSDLVERAREQKLDPVIGRDAEIRNAIRILSRKTKNNPVLIGEPGVGKTAVVEGLAQRIVRGDVPEGLKDKTIFSLDMVGLWIE